MKKKNKIFLSLSAILILANILYAKDSDSLDSITVTAQKSEENIQDVPISMSLFDEFSIQDKMLDNVADIAKYTPGLEIIGSSALKWSPSLRGLFDDYGSRSSTVALIVDGVPITDGTGFDETLMDIERIEVLRGPQGTLYGKNAEVGVINIITKKPNNETKGKILATFGSDNKKELAFSASGAVVKDKFYIGVSGKHSEKDGYVENTYLNKKQNDKENNYGKIVLRWTPIDDLEASFMSSKIKYNNGAGDLGLPNKNREVTSDFDSFSKSSVLLNALNISYNINDK